MRQSSFNYVRDCSDWLTKSISKEFVGQLLDSSTTRAAAVSERKLFCTIEWKEILSWQFLKNIQWMHFFHRTYSAVIRRVSFIMEYLPSPTAPCGLISVDCRLQTWPGVLCRARTRHSVWRRGTFSAGLETLPWRHQSLNIWSSQCWMLQQRSRQTN